MTLRPCSQCRRHFATESACPFCGARAPLVHARSFSPARLSRAAAFAGLALTGCVTREPAPQYVAPPPPPPPDQQHQQQPPPPPPPDTTQQKFADPPPAVGKGRVEGKVTDSTSHAALSGFVVQLVSTDQPPTITQRSLATDQSGHYAFVDLPPGHYVVKFGYMHPRRGQPQQIVVVGPDEVKTADMQIYTPPPSNIPMPYGAPPSRRRLV